MANEENQFATNKAYVEELETEIEQLRETMKKLQETQPIPMSYKEDGFQEKLDPTTSQRTNYKEPKLSLPEKFNGDRTKFRGFANQVRLFMFMQPLRYPTAASQVGLVGTLLTGTALNWFSPILEKNSPLLYDFEGFMEEFMACFGEVDKKKVADQKIRSLRQGGRSASIYASEFRQLSCDVDWGSEMALIRQFQWGLREDVKDLLLTLNDATSLSEAITQAVKCDNRLFLRRQEKKSSLFNHPPVVASSTSPSNNEFNDVKVCDPMQIDITQIKGPLSYEERERRKKEGLCFYCGSKDHKLTNCPKKPTQFHIRETKLNTQVDQKNTYVQSQ